MNPRRQTALESNVRTPFMPVPRRLSSSLLLLPLLLVAALSLTGCIRSRVHITSEPSGRVRGGYLGWIDSASLQPEIWEKVKGLKPGDISDPIVTDQGYHIIRVLGINGPRDLLFQQEFEKERIALIEELRAKAMIQFYDFEGKPVKEGAASKLEAPSAEAAPLPDAPKPEASKPAAPAPTFAPAAPADIQ